MATDAANQPLLRVDPETQIAGNGQPSGQEAPKSSSRLNPTDRTSPEDSDPRRLVSEVGASGVFVPSLCPGPAGTWPCALEFGHADDHERFASERSEGSGVDGHAVPSKQRSGMGGTVEATPGQPLPAGGSRPETSRKALGSSQPVAGIESGLPSLVSAESVTPLKDLVGELSAAIRNLRQERNELLLTCADLLAFVKRIAALGLCDDVPNNPDCSYDSGPYCGGHPNWIDEEVVAARVLIAKAEAR